jgi:surface protein
VKKHWKEVIVAALLIHLNIAQAFDQHIVGPGDSVNEENVVFQKEVDPNNPKLAVVNSHGCIDCTEYEVGETFILHGTKYIVVDNKSLFKNKRKSICVSHVTDMQLLFMDDKTIKDISNWDVSNVENMTGMFRGSSFNGDISNWDVSNVTNMSDMFSKSNFNGDIGKWNVKNVRSMSYMFYSAKNFNQDIGDWDIVWVSSMTSMFEGATSFNGNISSWDVSQVKEMDNIFYNAFNFVQDLSRWKFRLEMVCSHCLGHNINYNVRQTSSL